MIDMGNIDVWAVLVATAVSFLIGGFWYSALFSKPWMAALGINKEDVESSNLSVPKALIGSVVASAMTAFGVAMLLSSADPILWREGVLVALLVWAAFSMGPMFKMVLWEDRPWALLAIDGGYELVSVLAAAAIVIAWP